MFTAISGPRHPFDGIEDVADAELRFHLAVAAASGNDLFVAILESLHDSIEKGMYLTCKHSWADNDVRLKKTFGEHTQVFDAIAARNAEGARNAMRCHIETSRERILGKQKLPRPPDLT